MRTIISSSLAIVMVLACAAVPVKKIAADDFGPDQGSILVFPPAPFDPLMYEPASDPQSTRLKLVTRGSFGVDSAAARLLDRKVFDQLSSAGQRRALMLNGLAPNARRNGMKLFSAGGPAPNLDPQENVQVTREENDVRGPGRHTHSENSAAVVGDNAIISYNDNGGPVGFSGYGFSSDGGRAFTQQ